MIKNQNLHSSFIVHNEIFIPFRMKWGLWLLSNSIRKYVGALKCIWPAEDYANEVERGKTC